MFQDFEAFPKSFYGESHLGKEIWEWLELSEEDQELLRIYIEHVNQSGDIVEAREAYQGTYTSKGAWAQEYWEGSGLLDSIPSGLQAYIDYESFANDAGMGDITFAEVSYDEVYAFHNV